VIGYTEWTKSTAPKDKISDGLYGDAVRTIYAMV